MLSVARRFGDFEFGLMDIHTQPSDAVNEIDRLADVYDETVLALGTRNIISALGLLLLLVCALVTIVLLVQFSETTMLAAPTCLLPPGPTFVCEHVMRCPSLYPSQRLLLSRVALYMANP